MRGAVRLGHLSLPFPKLHCSGTVGGSSLFVRKIVFIECSQAFVVLPGGFGTIDELFEALTLVATEKTTKFPIVLATAPTGTAC